MRKLVLACLLFTLIHGGAVSAQTSWKLSGQIRQRFEIDNRDFSSDTDASTYNLLRSRLAITLTASKKIEAYFQIQDSRIFGEETSTLTDGSADNMDLHQGFIKVNDLFGAPLNLKIGRMEANYGPQRLIGAVGWHNIGRSFDGEILTVYGERLSVDFFHFMEVENLMIGDAGDKNVLGTYMDISAFEQQTIQAFLIWQRSSPWRLLNRFTAGFYSKGKIKNYSHEAEFAYQGGDITAGVRQDVQAFMAALGFAYVFAKAAAEPFLAVGVDYLSGDDNPYDGTYKVFDTMYATNHKYYGFMDYFLNIQNDTYGLGLLDIHAELGAEPAEKTKTSVVFHIFRANHDFSFWDGSSSADFGWELDLTGDYSYSENLSFTGGASVFSPGDIFKETRGPDTSSWFYVMTTISI